jgi:hypothetical protein
MRYRLMAAYRGAPYEAGVGPGEGDVVLFAACPPPEELGFEPATGHWRKQLRIEEVQALWESRPMGTFRGERCIVLDDLGDRLHIAYLGHDAYQAEQLGYWQVDRGVFELITPRDEVTDIVEERLDYPPRPAGAQPAVPDATAAGAPRDLAVIPPVSEPLPLEAAARRAASARIPQPAGPAMPEPAPPASQPAPRVPPASQPALSVPPAPQVPPIPQPAPPVLQPAIAVSAAQARPPAAQPATPAAQAAPPVAQQAATPAAQAAPPLPVPQPAAPAPESAPPGSQRQPAASRSRSRSALRRQATQRIFSELASLAAIPPSAYAVGEEVDGAMCLIQTPDGFEVFNAAAGARHEVRIFDDEESAYFYLFGVLAAEAVRTGRLAPQG